MRKRQRFGYFALVALVILAGRGIKGQTVCAGDCDGGGAVAVDHLITLVNVVLGVTDRSQCSKGIPAGQDPDVVLIIAAVGNALNGCPPTITPTDTVSPTALPPTPTPSPEASTTPSASPSVSGLPTETPLGARFCDLPGSVQTTADGKVVVPGDPDPFRDLRFLQLPDGFCAHYFAWVPNVRAMRFAPNGELFVTSPGQFTTGGGPGGKSAILMLADDNGDGFAEIERTFLGGIASTQGLMFGNGFLYYQNGRSIMRLPYRAGDRVPVGNSEKLAEVTIYNSFVHWPKPIDMADDGTIYIGNGGDQGDGCDAANAFHGGVMVLDPSFGGGARPVARGYRNPISVRCARGYNRCYAVELSRDYSNAVGGREKVVPIREGDDLGFPCCATKDLPYPDNPLPTDCSQVVEETGSFTIGDTPFDIDFETGLWPAPWSFRAYIPLHGVYSTWDGARLMALEMDPATGELLMGSNLAGQSSGALMDFATGWDDNTQNWGRPGSVTFAPDGRLFIGNDFNGDIIWIAPMDLRM